MLFINTDRHDPGTTKPVLKGFGGKVDINGTDLTPHIKSVPEYAACAGGLHPITGVGLLSSLLGQPIPSGRYPDLILA